MTTPRRHLLAAMMVAPATLLLVRLVRAVGASRLRADGKTTRRAPADAVRHAPHRPRVVPLADEAIGPARHLAG